MASEGAILQVRELRKDYTSGVLRRRSFSALSGVDLEVGRGSVFGLLGPNGAGKTTMVKILLGLVRGFGGRAELFGLPAGDPAARRRVGYLPEAHRLPGYLTGWQVMTLFGMLAGRPRREVERRAPELLERVGMLDDAKRKVREYSKGMQQRLGLAQALVHDPELVFLDEPTDGVDPVGRAAIRELVKELRAAGTTVFINSHLLMEVELICDRVVILSHGRVLREGSIDELTPSTGLVRFLLDRDAAEAAPLLDGLGTSLRTDGRLIELALAPEDIDAAIDRLRARGVGIRGVELRRLSLEAAFIGLVEESGGALGAPARAPRDVHTPPEGRA